MTKKDVLLPIAMFVLTMFGGPVYAQSTVVEINAAINRTRQEITELREKNPRLIHRALRQNPHYRYVMDYRDDVDSLRRENVRLIARAYDIVHRQNKNCLVPRNAMIFMLYSNLPWVSSLGTRYEMNCQQIKKYERHLAECKDFPQSVKNHYDSIMYVEIDRRQKLIDSLLNAKARLIR